jgi:leader peptidase (prepilin peptidase) / N-methyltransferase
MDFNAFVALLLTPVGLGLLGLCVGSFLNVVVHRVPLIMERQWWVDIGQQLADADSWKKVFGSELPATANPLAAHIDTAAQGLAPLSLMHPASRCPACGTAIRWYHNLPVLGWLMLGGKCAACKAPISLRYPLVEALTGALFLGLGWRLGAAPATLAWCAACAVLLALALIDWDTTLLPDSLTLPLLWAGLLAAAFGWTIPLPTALWGAVAGYLSLWSVYWAFKLLTGKEGMGYGDFKLLAALGAWLGWQALIPIVLLASVIGAMVGIAMKLNSTLREGRYVPFGPFLAGGGLAVLLVGLAPILQFMGWA